MELGVIGLGRMGGNIVRRLHRAGHHCVVYDANPTAVADLVVAPTSPLAVVDGQRRHHHRDCPYHHQFYQHRHRRSRRDRCSPLAGALPPDSR
jgi:nucleoside-diphosphate-sugar epimerase